MSRMISEVLMSLKEEPVLGWDVVYVVKTFLNM